MREKNRSKAARWAKAVLVAALGLVMLGGGAQEADAQVHQNFRVVTYNIRHITSDDTGVYDWYAREDAVLEMLRSRDPDVFGVQEVSNKPVRDAIRGAFKDDYDWIRPSGGSPKMIFFKKSRFERLSPNEEGNVRLDNPYSESESCRSNANGRTFAWIKLKDKKSGRIYLFMNIHTAHARDCWKARNESMDQMLDFMEEHIDSGATFVVLGDFNTDEQRDPPFDERDKTATTLEANRPGLRMRRSARWSGKTSKSTRTFNHAWKKSSNSYGRYDYIFVNSLDATTYRQSTDQQTIKDIMGSGADISPSDHFLVRAEIRHAPFDYLPAVSHQEGASNDHISFGDVNGDGRVDLIRWKTSVHSGKVRVHLADEAGNFASEAIVDANEGETGEWRYFADIDGDGCADRISWKAGKEGGALRVGKSNCDGTFESSEVHSPGTTKSGTKWFFAKLNDDECYDRIAWHPDVEGGQTRVALAKCDGSLEFEAEQVTTDEGSTANSDATIAFADINGDGLADKILWDLDQYSGRTVVYTSQGDGDFELFHEHKGGHSGVKSTRLFFGDVDGDGYAEKGFWRPNYRQGYMQLYPGSEDGLITHPMMVNSGPSEHENTDFFLADVNGDGSDDLIRWNLKEDPNKIEVYLALVTQEQDDPEDPEDPEDPTDPEDPVDPEDPTDPDPSDPDAGSGAPDAFGEDVAMGDGDDAGGDGGGESNAGDGEDEKNTAELSGGCGCSNTGGPAPGGLAALLLGAGAIWLRRRK